MGEEREEIKKWCPMVRTIKTGRETIFISNRGEFIADEGMTPDQFACLGSKCAVWDALSSGVGDCGLKRSR